MKKILCLLAFIPFVANAGLYVEPYLGYGIGEVEESDGGPKIDTKGPVYGARLGVTKLGFMLGYEYSMMDSTYEYNDADEDVETTLHGIYLGYRVPRIIPIIDKVWGTYSFAGESKYKDFKVDVDNALSIGVGISPIPVPLPFVSLNVNLEYRNVKTDTYDSEHDEVSSWILSVSAPINF